MCVSLVLALSAVPKVSEAMSEYKVKAAFLLNFGKFVEWPSEALVDGELRICVLGNDPFGSTLDKTLAGRSVGSNKVKPLRVSAADGARGCQIVFVSESEKAHVDQIVSTFRGSPVLLVSETDRFVKRGGMINFVEVDSKVRFEINEGAAKQAGLKISSQLLKLATAVE